MSTVLLQGFRGLEDTEPFMYRAPLAANFFKEGTGDDRKGSPTESKGGDLKERSDTKTGQGGIETQRNAERVRD
jgi:hypothetical protein